MPQTLLALCAVLVFSIYALNSSRDDAATERTAVASDAESSAADVARGRVAAAERLAFDEQDIGRTSIRLTPPTSTIGPDGGEANATLHDDIDDLHGLIEERASPAGDGLLRFRVTYTVRYVNPATLAASTVPTLAKEMHVRAVEITTGPTGRPAVAVSLRKVFTPAGMTSFRR